MEAVISISSAVIALCALGVSIWQGFLTRQHQRKSVTPLISLSHISLNYESIEICIKNNGLGPAIILTYALSVNGKKTFINSEDDCYEFINKLNLGEVEAEIYIPTTGSYIAVGQQIILLSIKPLRGVMDYNDFRKLIFSCEPEIEYKSIFGEKFSTNLNEDD
jgi:hypothetical protein